MSIIITIFSNLSLYAQIDTFRIDYFSDNKIGLNIDYSSGTYAIGGYIFSGHHGDPVLINSNAEWVGGEYTPNRKYTSYVGHECFVDDNTIWVNDYSIKYYNHFVFDVKTPQVIKTPTYNYMLEYERKILMFNKFGSIRWYYVPDNFDLYKEYNYDFSNNFGKLSSKENNILAVTDRDSILLIDMDNNFKIIHSYYYPNAKKIKLDSGNLWVLSNNTLHCVEYNGSFCTYENVSTFDVRSDTLLIADYGFNKINKITLNGDTLNTYYHVNADINNVKLVEDTVVSVSYGYVLIHKPQILSGTLEEYKSKPRVYPNPSKGIVNIEFNEKYDLKIYDRLGKLIMTTSKNKVILNSGIYCFVFINSSSKFSTFWVSIL